MIVEKVIIFGLGDISKIAHYYLSEDDRYEVVAFTIDNEYKDIECFENLPVISFDDVESLYPPQDFKMFIPLSYTRLNKLREQKFLEAKVKGYEFISYISPKAFVAENAKVGVNCFIFEDNTIQPFVNIKDNCILWSGNHIGHHSIIKENCFLASHVVISGGCEIDKNTFIGVNATLRDHIKVGKFNVIGAGVLILKSTEDHQVYMEKATELARVPSNRLRGI